MPPSLLQSKPVQSHGEVVTIAVAADGEITQSMSFDPDADVQLEGAIAPVMGYQCGEFEAADLGDALTIAGSRPARQRLQRLVRANRRTASRSG